MGRLVLLVLLGLAMVAGFLMLTATGAHATGVVQPTAPATPSAPASPSSGGFSVSVNGPDGQPSSAVVTLIGITLLSVAPALMLMMTSFTKIFVVLAMT
ncbi:MAG: EscR/YscR/HrcR family type III secretion system export apparatus protein, partial [Curtobacterium sp.]